MAGHSIDGDVENPVAINITPLVDIIFCLCVFFMISFKFKQIEGKFDVWLPKNTGGDPQQAAALLDELRVALFWDADAGRTIRQLAQRRVASDAELLGLLSDARADAESLGIADMPVTIDADVRVPWDDVVGVVNLCKRARIERIQFALGAPPAK